jgi:hypothetical protein
LLEAAVVVVDIGNIALVADVFHSGQCLPVFSQALNDLTTGDQVVCFQIPKGAYQTAVIRVNQLVFA